MLKFLVSSLSQQSASPHGGFFAVASDTSKPLNLSMVLMSYNNIRKGSRFARFVRSPTRRLTQAPPEERFALKVLILFAPLTISVSDVL